MHILYFSKVFNHTSDMNYTYLLIFYIFKTFLFENLYNKWLVLEVNKVIILFSQNGEKCLNGLLKNCQTFFFF